MKKPPLHVGNTLFFSISFAMAVAAVFFYALYGLFTPFHLILFLGMLSLTLTSISGGYHRLYAHRSYEGKNWLKIFFLLFGAAAFEQSCRKWATEHRIHHRFVDTEIDPYNIKEGFWWAHIGWILHMDKERFETPKDLLNDPLIVWQDRYWIWIAISMGFLFPLLVGAYFGDPIGGFLFGGVVRMVVGHHLTFFINSLAHTIGNSTYTDENSAKDSWITAIFTVGEGYHNYHHWSPSDYRNGVRFFHWDPPKWVILGLSWIGQTWEFKRTNEEDVVKARAEMQLKKVKSKIQLLPDRLHEQFDQLQKSIEELSRRRREWTQAKKAMLAHEADILQQKFKAARRDFIAAKRAWKSQVASYTT